MRLAMRMKGICLVFAAILAAMLWLSSTSVPPLLMVSELHKAEDGMYVRLQGLVAELREHDTGYLSMVLVDCVNGETVLTLHPPAARAALFNEVSTGDEVLVTGRVASGSSSPIVYADSRGTEVLCKSAFAMSVELLCANWPLFEYDRLNVSGIIEVEEESGYAWLADPLGAARLRIRTDADRIDASGDALVVVDCTLLMDTRTMGLYLRVWSITARAG